MTIDVGGISNKSFIISMAATLSGFAAVITCLAVFTPATSNWIQIPAAVGTIALFVVGIAAWGGFFEKKINTAPVAVPRPKQDPKPVIQQKAPPDEPKDNVEEWLKQYSKKEGI